MATMAMLREAAAIAGRIDAMVGTLNGAKGKVAATLGTFGPQVQAPLSAGGAWSGEGQPEALAVVTTNDLALKTSKLRLGQAAETASAFAGGLRLVGAQWAEIEQTLSDNFYFTVAEDGTVTVTSGVTPPPGAPDPGELTRRVKGLLRRTDELESAFASRFGELTGDLPKPTYTFAAGIVGQARAAHEAAVTDGVPRPVGSPVENWRLRDSFERGSIEEWARLVGPLAGLGGAGLFGGGFLTGPDGRRYPIVTPVLSRNGTWYSIGTGELGGRDPGWYTVDRRVGFGQLEEGADLSTSIAAFLAGTAGVRPVGQADPGQTRSITLDEDGVPVSVGPATPERERPPSGPLPHEPVDPGARINAGNLAVVAINGAENVANIDNGTYYTYNVEFQQNTDGRQRAIVTAYQAVPNDDGSVDILPHNVHVGQDGELVFENGRQVPRPQPAEVARSADAPPLEVRDPGEDAQHPGAGQAIPPGGR